VSVGPAIDEVVQLLRDAGLDAADEPGTFYPSPIACLVGCPDLRLRGLGQATIDLPVHVVCGQPLDGRLRTLLFDEALVAADALGVESFALSGWAGAQNDTELPAYLLTVPVTYAP
jgi:hypothetical protein